MALFGGSSNRYRQLPLYGPEQKPLFQQLQKAGMGPGAGGAFGSAADYYYGNLGNNPADFEAFAAPELRRYNQQTIPNLAEQYAGMGAGTLSSSGFANSAATAGADLGERLAMLRSQLRESAAQNLTNIGQQGLQRFYENVQEQPAPGFLDYAGQIIGPALSAVGGPVLGKLGGLASQYLTSKFNQNRAYQPQRNVGSLANVSGRL